ncbi:hypothetical protein NCLIV_023900 [Neospora caninum Liverpool]|uniref:Cilia- and flagella-associated protein 58 central coiled coil domain-containing protein n=1 Tax=Neospora caninum (strain Liverpool) TaxID=572307 RepID=F0VFV7_NEOCL|nr:hypothetical protein NCLIV_023900 [Neospora caninum Liverpool]CBZ52601.1 hypothetical protein NCLIV_023900 [Neospora caninum Liverpool]|eukprot:XP_003882633.1 hypothetical protein NCLIV_023900 [Neospora caninum Liverpool]
MEEDAMVSQEEVGSLASGDRGGLLVGSEDENNLEKFPSNPLNDEGRFRCENLERDTREDSSEPVLASQEDGPLGRAAYVALEESFDQTLKDLPDDPNLNGFRRQYEKLLGALKRSHESEMSLLARQIEATETEHISQETKLEEYLQEREKLLRECDQLAAHNAQMSTDNEHMGRSLETLERQVAEAQDELIQTKDVLRIKKLEGDQEQRRREKIEKELKDMKALIEQKQTEIHGKQVTIEQQQQETEHLQAVVASLQAENEKENKKFMEITGRIMDTENRLNEQIIKNSKMQAANIAREAELRDQAEVINKLKADKEKVTKMHDLLKRKIQQTEDDRKALDDQHAGKTGQLAEADKKNIGNLLRERDLLSKNLLRTDDATKKHEEALKRHEAHAVQLQREAERYRKDIETQQAKIRELESHRDKSGAELSKINQKYLAVLEEIKGGDNQVTDLQKTITELRNKLATQKSLYESVRSDRNLYSRNLIESLDEISEMKQKFKILYHQIEQLKEEVKQKDASLIKGHFEQHKIIKDNEKITSDLHSAQHKLSSLQQIVLSQNERDMLGTQLLRRNEELSLLYEKIKIQQSTLQKGEAQYRFAWPVLGLFLSTSERTKVKALSESLENPMNVHRWRRLEGSDPSKLEMLAKIQSLQKRLIAKTDQVIDRDLMIQEKEKLYVELKTKLAAYPGPQTAEQMQVFQRTLREKTAQLKAMTCELKTCHKQVVLYKDEIAWLNRELAAIKTKDMEERRKTALGAVGRSSSLRDPESAAPPLDSTHSRGAGKPSCLQVHSFHPLQAVRSTRLADTPQHAGASAANAHGVCPAQKPPASSFVVEEGVGGNAGKARTHAAGNEEDWEVERPLQTDAEGSSALAVHPTVLESQPGPVGEHQEAAELSNDSMEQTPKVHSGNSNKHETEEERAQLEVTKVESSPADAAGG